MKACVAATVGYEPTLSLVDVPFPAPRDVLAVMGITAAGVNRADVLQRQGLYPPPPGASPYLGLEAAGTLLAAPASSGWAPGMRACALLTGGGYAEQVAVEPDLLLPVPDGLSDVEAASLVEASCTVISNLDAADARDGETLLVHGGSGGVGTAAIQIAKARGMRVIATAGGPARAARCAALGADLVLDHRAEDWVEAVRADGGAHVILDVVGAAYLGANLRALRTGGRLVVIGLQKGARGEIDLGTMLAKRATLIATTLRARPLAERAAIVARVRDEVWPLIPDRLRPVVHATVPLERAAEAHRMLEAGEVFGKVVLTVA